MHTMGDIVDHANDLAYLRLSAALQNIPEPRPPSPICLNCDEPLPKGRFNFCDNACRDDRERYDTAVIRNRPAHDD